MEKNKKDEKIGVLILTTREERDALKVKAKANGYKTVSQFTRRRWKSVDADSDTLKEIIRVRDLTIPTRQKLANSAIEINEISRAFNQGYKAEVLIKRDYEIRENLKPLLFDMLEQNKKLIALCNKVLGRTK